MRLSKEQLAYMAGFVDADGSIGICSDSANAQCNLRLSVTNRDYRVVKIFANAFGTGKMRRREHVKHKNWQPIYEWTISANRALYAIKLMRPYLRIKSKQADLGIKLQQLKSSYSSNEKARNPKLMAQLQSQYLRLKTKCHALNKRGK